MRGARPSLFARVGASETSFCKSEFVVFGFGLAVCDCFSHMGFDRQVIDIVVVRTRQAVASVRVSASAGIFIFVGEIKIRVKGYAVSIRLQFIGNQPLFCCAMVGAFVRFAFTGSWFDFVACAK